MLTSFKNALKLPEEDRGDLVEKLFGIELENTVKNTEDPEEPPQVQKENVLRLSCHIDNNNKPIDHLAEGLKISLNG